MADLRGEQEGAPAAPTANPDAPTARPDVPAATIAGFWRRLFALFVDMLLLAAVGFAIGTFAFAQMVALGQQGRLIGAAITLAYFGILNTGWAGGTFGKRVTGLRVIRRDGQTIGLFRSLLRTIIFWTPYYLNGVFFSSVHIPGLPVDPRIDLAVGILDGIAVFGGTAFIAYLYLFNTKTRQSLHDLIAGTYVVVAGSVGAPVRAQFWKGHLAIATGISLVLVGIPLGLLGYLSTTSIGSALNKAGTIQSTVLDDPAVATAAVTVSSTTWSTISSGQSSTVTRTSLDVKVQLRAVPASMEAAQNEIAMIVLRKDPSNSRYAISECRRVLRLRSRNFQMVKR